MFTIPVGFFQSNSGILVPSGLIIPYNGTTAPTGWTLFTSADGKFIIGAGNTYAVAATGGNTSLTTAASDSAGSHSVASPSTYTYPSGTYGIYGSAGAGSHTHTLTYSYEPPYYGLRLIKADSDLSYLPAKAVMFSGSSLSGLSRFSSGDGKLFSSRTSIGAGGSNDVGAGTSSSSGSHAHGTSKSSMSFTSGTVGQAAGSHTHSTVAFEITPNLYRALLSAWTDASNAFNLQTGMYAFYENVTPPDGWLLCNGSNGTLDLRDYFIAFTDETDDGTRDGDGTLTVPEITVSSDNFSHGHATSDYCGKVSQYHHQNINYAHDHVIVGSTPTYLPPYYALAIIQLAA